MTTSPSLHSPLTSALCTRNAGLHNLTGHFFFFIFMNNLKDILAATSSKLSDHLDVLQLEPQRAKRSICQWSDSSFVVFLNFHRFTLSHIQVFNNMVIFIIIIIKYFVLHTFTERATHLHMINQIPVKNKLLSIGLFYLEVKPSAMYIHSPLHYDSIFLYSFNDKARMQDYNKYLFRYTCPY